ncbi:MAG: hypothetical protein B0D92_02825 [Spirochaeta sp. LUC14_002_19_P3]|nr:MAG: hypothetical protein B0D92_02825 [Spirochaeta sp. LUC14_002_19_P3]
MPGRLIGFIVILLLIGTLIGFNIGNSSDIRIWFGEKGQIKEVPILLSFFTIYIFGLVSSIPFYIGWRMRQIKKKRKNSAAAADKK